MLLDCPVATKRKGIPGNSLTNQVEDSQVADGELLKFAESLQYMCTLNLTITLTPSNIECIQIV